jgi:hypothetical protein
VFLQVDISLEYKDQWRPYRPSHGVYAITVAGDPSAHCEQALPNAAAGTGATPGKAVVTFPFVNAPAFDDEFVFARWTKFLVPPTATNDAEDPEPVGDGAAAAAVAQM